MIYGSVCSGIEAASVAWNPLGWEAAFFSEIEKFPSAVLAHHYPDVPNRGDMTKFKEWSDAKLDVLVGGTPCQSFSIAGLRKGLDDPRGNLMLTYLAIAARFKPDWLVWENVPGVLSSGGGRDFGTFLGGLGQLGYGFAYRILDAQYVGVPQRRRRVFVVGCLGDWRCAAAVLFERHSLSGDIAPSRKKGQEITGTIGARTTAGGGFGGDFETTGGLQAVSSTGDIGHCLNVGGMGRQDYETETLIAHSLRGEGFDASEDGTGRGTPLVPVAFTNRGIDTGETGETLRAGSHGALPMVAFAQNQRDEVRMMNVAGALEAEPGMKQQTYVAFDMRGREGGSQLEGPHDTANIRAASGGSSRSYISSPMQVRRLTPRECERLQGFPDFYTLIPGKSADGPRYKALGNSMAVPVMRWIGERIDAVSRITSVPKKEVA